MSWTVATPLVCIKMYIVIILYHALGWLLYVVIKTRLWRLKGVASQCDKPHPSMHNAIADTRASLEPSLASQSVAPGCGSRSIIHAAETLQVLLEPWGYVGRYLLRSGHGVVIPPFHSIPFHSTVPVQSIPSFQSTESKHPLPQALGQVSML